MLERVTPWKDKFAQVGPHFGGDVRPAVIVCGWGVMPVEGEKIGSQVSSFARQDMINLEKTLCESINLY